MINDKYFYKDSEIYYKVDKTTGEYENLVVKGKIKNLERFFMATFDAWDEFEASEYGLIPVFIKCIVNSSQSKAGIDPEGNYFRVSDVIYDMKSISPASIRNSICRLVKKGCVMKTDRRGVYVINPKYGIKGTISEYQYAKLILEFEK